HLALEGIEPLDIGARSTRADALLFEDLLLNLLQLGLECVHDREIAVDHGIHQCVEHIAAAQSQQMRLALGPAAHTKEALAAAAAHREYVVAANEDIDL